MFANGGASVRKLVSGRGGPLRSPPPPLAPCLGSRGGPAELAEDNGQDVGHEGGGSA